MEIAIYDGRDVVEGVTLDAKALAVLARDLHDSDRIPHHDDWPSTCDTKELQDAYAKNYERLVEDNGGYCNDCKRLAGFILSHFNITERDDVP